jgi:hypothetical protein
MRQFSTKLYFALVACLLSAGILTSCSSNELLESGTSEQTDKAVTFTAQKGFIEDEVTRANIQPQTQRVILSDGLLVDATLIDESNANQATRTSKQTGTPTEAITTGTGVAFVCSGTTIVRKQNIAVSGGQISVMIPPAGTYDVYMYLCENTSLSLADANIPDDNINNVTFTSRPLGTLDDHAKVTGITVSSTTLGSPITFTPLGSQIKLTVNAGVTPLTGFSATLTNIQAAGTFSNVHVADGTYTVSGKGNAISFVNDCYNVDADREYPSTYSDATYAGARYADKLVSRNGYQAFASRKPFVTNATQDTAVAILTINSISGPDGTNANTTTTYTTNNVMNFTNLYKDGHRYNLVLNLATPIYGYEAVGTDGVQLGSVNADVNSTPCLTGKITAQTPTFTPQLSSAAKWPCPIGRPQFYRWDAEAYSPTTGTSGIESTQNVGITDNASHSCKLCPTYNQATWLLSAGTYGDNGPWYCPNGFKDTRESTKNNIKVQTGGRWFKKMNLISGYYGTTPAKIGSTVITNLSQVANIASKPGVAKLSSTVTNPNEWFFLPAPGYYGANGNTNFSGEGLYWLSTVSSDVGKGYCLNMGISWCAITLKYRYLGMCIWNNYTDSSGNAGSTTSTTIDLGAH